MGIFNQVTTIEKTAYHEAGHAVAAFLYGRRFLKISIIFDEKDFSLGRVIYPITYWKGFAPDGFKSNTRMRIEEEILKVFAGEVAEGLFSGRLNWRSSREHLTSAKKLARYVCGSQAEADAFVDWLWKREIHLMKDPPRRAAVQALAEELLQKKEIGYQEARQIIEKAMVNCRKQEKASKQNQESFLSSSLRTSISRSRLRRRTAILTR